MSHVPFIVVRGAGDIATGVVVELKSAGYERILLLEQPRPLAVRRRVALSEAVYDGAATVEGLHAEHVDALCDAQPCWARGVLPVLVDPHMECLQAFTPDVFIDATLAKTNHGVHRHLAPLVVGLGPGFTAGLDVDVVVETHREADLGAVITSGMAAPNTGVPGALGGQTTARVLRASHDSVFSTSHTIGQLVASGDVVGHVDDVPVVAGTSGVLRGLLRSGTPVTPGTKLGDVDPRADVSRCTRITAKARTIGRGVLLAIHNHCNQLEAACP